MEVDEGERPLPDQAFRINVPEGANVLTMLCCECGITIPVNPSAMCVNCLRGRVDITEGIPKQGTLYFCKGCERYLSPPSSWVSAPLESRELLALCLKRLKGLNKVHLIDAGFIWTEPHSKRIKVRVSIQMEVFGAILQQVFIVEYVVHHEMCLNCHRKEAKDTWTAVVQVRQKATHKKTFLYLEQLIVKHNAHTQCVNIKAEKDGIDFYFGHRNEAKRLTEFLACVVPTRSKTSEQLISADIHSNTFNFKFTYSVEIVPICKDDVVCLPVIIAKQLGNISQVLICSKVNTNVALIDPVTLQKCEIRQELYFNHPFASICSQSQLTEYIVIDIEPVYDATGAPIVDGKFALADAYVARVKDFGSNDIQFITRTHLGFILQPGDNVWGFDLTCSNINDVHKHGNRLDLSKYPDVMLVKKSFTEKRRTRRRQWKLKPLEKVDMDMTKREHETQEREFEEFMQELEEDVDLRGTINIYKDSAVQPATLSEAGDDPELVVGLDEMLDDFDTMRIGGDGPDDEDEEEIE